MRLQFPMSKLTELRTNLRANPDATGVVLTHAEFADVIGELLDAGDTNAALIGGMHRKTFQIDSRTIEVTLEAK